ncbi:hypothetical protein LTR53_007176 [Teratosphaeriaceae sp. CCFEE 6253]|nr:hypothetical protein LTR53_007176 [Teratosphaeriaceae sp. CCFEE 6253]
MLKTHYGNQQLDVALHDDADMKLRVLLTFPEDTSSDLVVPCEGIMVDYLQTINTTYQGDVGFRELLLHIIEMLQLHQDAAHPSRRDGSGQVGGSIHGACTGGVVAEFWRQASDAYHARQRKLADMTDRRTCSASPSTTMPLSLHPSSTSTSRARGSAYSMKYGGKESRLTPADDTAFIDSRQAIMRSYDTHDHDTSCAACLLTIETILANAHVPSSKDQVRLYADGTTRPRWHPAAYTLGKLPELGDAFICRKCMRNARRSDVQRTARQQRISGV